MGAVNFQEPYSEETRKKLEEAFGIAAASDSRSLLFNQMATVQQKLMSAIAREEKQPVVVSLHEPGEIKEMEDGTRYQCTEQGDWRRIWP